jgi:hypothetical protein
VRFEISGYALTILIVTRHAQRQGLQAAQQQCRVVWIRYRAQYAEQLPQARDYSG